MKFEDFSTASDNQLNLFYAKAAEILMKHPNCTVAEKEQYYKWQKYYEQEYRMSMITYYVMVRMSTAAIADSRLLTIKAENKDQAMKLAVEDDIVSMYASQFSKANFQPYVTQVYVVKNGELVEDYD